VRLSPNPFHGGAQLLHVVLRAQPHWGEARAEVRDLRGRLVRGLEGGVGGEFRRWVWNGRDHAGRSVEPGAYLVWIEIQQQGAATLQLRELLAVGVAR
jgi:hypothetical protein